MAGAKICIKMSPYTTTPVVGSETINAVVEEIPVAIGDEKSAGENVEVVIVTARTCRFCSSKRVHDFKSCRYRSQICLCCNRNGDWKNVCRERFKASS